MDDNKLQVGVGVLIAGFIAGILFRQPDPIRILIQAAIEVLKSFDAPKIFIILLFLVYLIYKVSEIIRIISMGLFAVLTFVFGFIAGVMALYNQTLCVIFFFIGFFFAILFSLSIDL